MKPRTKRFFASLVSLCLLGTTSLPVAAAAPPTTKTPDSFYEDVQELVSDYGMTGTADSSSRAAPSTMRLIVQSTKNIDGNTLGAARTVSDGQGWYILQFDSEDATQSAYEQLSGLPGVLSVEEDQIIALEEEPATMQEEADAAHNLCLNIQSAQSINGDALGAARTLSDGKGRYVLQFDNENAAQAAYAQLSANPEVLGIAWDEKSDGAQGSLGFQENREDMEKVEEETETASETKQAASTHLSWGAERLSVDSWVSQMTDAQKNRPVTVAVLDTGINDHEFFGGRMQEGIRLIDESTGDVDGHGTHVAGIIADMTQGTQTKLVSVKVLGDNGRGSSLTVANGIRWAMEHDVDVINMSLSGEGHSSYEEAMVRQAVRQNIVVVAAAGNDSADTSGYCPADVQELLCVSAIGTSKSSTDPLAYFTNFGDSVDLAAPGVGILSTLNNGKTGMKSGTSMATPHVAGAAALVKAVRPDISAQRIGKILTDASDDRGEPGWDPKYGYGVVTLSKLSVREIETASTQPPVSLEKENVSVSYNSITVNNLPDTVTSVILWNETNDTLLSEQQPENGSVTFHGLSSSTNYALSCANLDGTSTPLAVRTVKKPYSGGSSGGGGSSAGNTTSSPISVAPPISTLPAPEQPDEQIPVYAAASLLDTEHVALNVGNPYQFLVKENHDTENIKVEVGNPAILDVQLIDKNDPRGAKYQVNPKAAGTITVNVIYGGQIASMSVTVAPQKKASLTLDTTSYTMAPGGQYTVGAVLKDKDGAQLTTEQVNALIAEKRLVIRDSRTGSVFTLTQLPDGNAQITGNQAGVGYLLYEIDGVHASVRITVADNAKAQGDSTRNTLYF